MLSRDLPIEQVAVESIREVDTEYWFDGSAEVPTVRKVVEHARLISEVDTSYPIILGHDGRVMDGMHRIARALLEGRTVIGAVRFGCRLSRTIEAAPRRSCRADPAAGTVALADPTAIREGETSSSNVAVGMGSIARSAGGAAWATPLVDPPPAT